MQWLYIMLCAFQFIYKYICLKDKVIKANFLGNDMSKKYALYLNTQIYKHWIKIKFRFRFRFWFRVIRFRWFRFRFRFRQSLFFFLTQSSVNYILKCIFWGGNLNMHLSFGCWLVWLLVYIFIAAEYCGCWSYQSFYQK